MGEESGAGVAEAQRSERAQAPSRQTGRRFVRRQPLTLLDRIIAASAHLAILLSLPGLLYALALWLALRGRAPYIAHHARQAFWWQILTNVALVIMLAILFIAAFVSLGGTLNGSNGGVNLVGLFGSLLGLFIVLIVGAAFAIGSALVGAVASFVGYTFHYPIVNRKRRGD